ncbi:MAG: oligosaccharide flippase family protein [Bacteroidales bacterium]|nr:oligosaccharide flippase family protein [Bacteroidales bacterium]
MGKIQRLIGQTLIYGLGTMIPRLLNFVILTPYYTRIFKPDEYGIITELYAYIIVLQVLLTYGMETGYFRFSRDEKRKGLIYSIVQTSVLFTSVLFIIVTFLLGKSIANVLGYENKVILIFAVGLIVSMDAFSAIPFAKLRMEGKAMKFAIIKIINVVITLILVFGFLSFFPAYCLKNTNSILCALYVPEYKVEYVFIANIVASFFVLIMLFKEIYESELRFDIKIFTELLKFSLPVLIAGIGGSLTDAMDRILLKHLIKDGSDAMYQLGIYGANIKLSVIMMLFVQMFRYAAEPFYFENMYDKNAKNLYADVMKVFVFIGMLIFLFVLLNLNVFKLFIGRNYYEGLKIVPVVMMSYLFIGIQNNASIWYKITKKTMVGAYITAIGAILTIVFNYMLVPKFGYYGAAVTRLLTFGLMAAITIYLGNKKYFIPYRWSGIFLAITLSILFFILFSSLKLNESRFWFIYANSIVILYVFIIITFDKQLRKEAFKLSRYGRYKDQK